MLRCSLKNICNKCFLNGVKNKCNNPLELKDLKQDEETERSQCFACIQWCPKTAIQFKKRTLGVERYHHPDIKINEMVHKKEK